MLRYLIAYSVHCHLNAVDCTIFSFDTGALLHFSLPPDVVNGQADIILSLGNGYIGHIRAHSEYISRRNRQLRQADDEAQLADRSEDLRELLPASAAADANRAGSPIQTLRAAR